MKTAALLMIVLVAGASLSGCLKKEPVEAANVEQQKADEILGKTGRDALVDAAALIPKNYSFPGQALLPEQLVEFVGTVTTAANGGIEGLKDESGVEHGAFIEMQDISSLVPPGQPVELVIDLIWDASEANSADLDIIVDLPGTRSATSNVDESFNWNMAVKQVVVNTVGVAGVPAQIGIQAASGVVTQGFDYTLRVHAQYVKDVLTPYHPWAFDVPSGASGIILESEKAGGEEHVTAQFVVIGPDDELVQFVDFNDIDIPTESVFIPTTKAGTHVFYAYFMHGGFFRVKADVPLDANGARPLGLVETRVADNAAPAPGVAGKDMLEGSAAGGTMPSEDVSPVIVDFTTSGTFPLRITGYITGQASTQSKIVLSSPLGEVHKLAKIARYEDESGSIGYTSDREGSPNNVFQWQNIQRGAWSAQIVNTSPGVEIGHTILTYARS